MGEATPAFRCRATGHDQAQSLFFLVSAFAILPVDLAEFEQAQVWALVVPVACHRVQPLQDQGLAKGVELRAQGVEQGHRPVRVERFIRHEGQVCGRDQGIVHGLVEATPDEDAGPFRSEALRIGVGAVRQAHLHPAGQGDVVVAMNAEDFFHHIGRAGHVAPVSRHFEVQPEVVFRLHHDVEVGQNALDTVAVQGDADPLVEGVPFELDFGRLGKRPFGPLQSSFDGGAGMGLEQVDRELESRPGRQRVNAPFEPEGRIGGQRVPLGALADGDRFEPGAFEEDPRGGLRYARHCAAKDTGEAHRLVLVCDDEVGGVQFEGVSVEGGEGFARGGAPHLDGVAGNLVRVKGVEGLAEVVQHIVGDVDHVVLGLDADGAQALLHPIWRGADLDAAECDAEVQGRAFCVLDIQGNGAVAHLQGQHGRCLQRFNRAALAISTVPFRRRPQVAGDPAVPHGVGAVGGEADFDAVVGFQAEGRSGRGAGFEGAVEDEDAVVV